MRAGPFGDRAVEIVARNVRHARAIARGLVGVEGVRETVVGWDRVVAHVERDPHELLAAIEAATESIPDDDVATGALHVVTAVYDGPDLEEVARARGLTVAEVIARHSAVTYEVEVVGFLPGFAYLGGVDPTITLPRRKNPRPRVPALSIGIADERTAIYPSASPGGWNLIGRVVDFIPFDPASLQPSRLAVGDRVRFEVRC